MILSGCSKQTATEESYADEKMNVNIQAVDAAASAPVHSTVTSAPPQLAYDYDYGFSSGTKGVDALINADQSACAKAGQAACQMISMRADNNPGSGFVRKTLELRVTPEWMKIWQGQLSANLKNSNAHIFSQNVTSEDLSLQIVDTDAHLKNKLALRDRLLNIIKNNPGKIGDLVEAETQLSQVQSDIDSAQSTLAVLQKRVATTHLTLTYQSEAAAASHNTFSPVTDAFRNILNNMMIMLGIIISAAAFLIPLLIVIVPLIWLFVKWFRKRKASKIGKA
ncbi:hypothetical protein ABENE_13375 [Asticcacaulis benevestitus DSM 16100 = ATCC BAA-896]|uniref:DUF4349 domain-containing protein n=2 Tax=Asticcacaulis TaxID=76890 RepID=V4PVX9_9CAUL|nr:hypothetical protein ABENE_13375 [Asticcacaulis benevestitus DSM 16100 = ATCC BAA-896]